MDLNDHCVQIVPVKTTRGFFPHLLFLQCVSSHCFGPKGRKCILHSGGSVVKAKLTSLSSSLIEALTPNDTFGIFLQNLILRHVRSFRDQGLFCILVFLELLPSAFQPSANEENDSLNSIQETLVGSKYFGVHVEFLSLHNRSLPAHNQVSINSHHHLLIALDIVEEWIHEYFNWKRCPVIIRWTFNDSSALCSSHPVQDEVHQRPQDHQFCRQERFLRAILRSFLTPKLNFRLREKELNFLIDLVLEAYTK
eukprot:768230-Hanusia_phi.AAC.2